MDDFYYKTVSQLEKEGVDREYIVGWTSGYLHNPEREEQRVTEGYSAGYEDGKNKTTEHKDQYKH